MEVPATTTWRGPTASITVATMSEPIAECKSRDSQDRDMPRIVTRATAWPGQRSRRPGQLWFTASARRNSYRLRRIGARPLSHRVGGGIEQRGDARGEDSVCDGDEHGDQPHQQAVLDHGRGVLARDEPLGGSDELAHG